MLVGLLSTFCRGFYLSFVLIYRSTKEGYCGYFKDKSTSNLSIIGAMVDDSFKTIDSIEKDNRNDGGCFLR